ncbi:MAG TPA: serine/threonine-protein kinase, partial [Chloroflexota bacterium]
MRALPQQGAPPIPASFVNGRYQVKQFLGEGGKKRVYLAHDAQLDRDVAFALLKSDGLDLEGLVRIRREAQAMGRLGDHPHIVTVFDIGDEDGQPYIVSQYMAGGSLQALIENAEDHRIPLHQALTFADQVCQALEHAHRHDVIHRDLKPGNVWLSAVPRAIGEMDSGSPNASRPGEIRSAMLGDFGLAMALDRSRLTQAGMMVGTVSYMSPEQALGGEVTPKSDLYSLGALLYELVTGRPPFLGDESVAIITQHL